jgi:all-trans-retinol dehydrogenase (NAD+)
VEYSFCCIYKLEMYPYLGKSTRFILFVLERIRATSLAVTTRILELIVLCWLSVYYVSETLVLTVTPSVFRRQKNLGGKVVLLTGGAGGVGQELALRLAKHKARVVIWDYNEKALEKVVEKIEAEGYKVHAYPVDVSDKKNVYKYAEIVKSDVGHVDVVINNAGVVCGQTFLDIPDYMIEKTFKVNILAHYWVSGKSPVIHTKPRQI